LIFLSTCVVSNLSYQYADHKSGNYIFVTWLVEVGQQCRVGVPDKSLAVPELVNTADTMSQYMASFPVPREL